MTLLLTLFYVSYNKKMIMKKNKKNLKRLLSKLNQTKKAINLFFKQTNTNFVKMKNKLKTIWAAMPIFILLFLGIQSCNVTRKVTTESSYYTKGDTTCTIITKTIESYDATKKGLKQ